MLTKAAAAGTRPETELLLCCARTCMDSVSAERIKALLREDIDWAYLIETVLRHGTMPLLYWNLNATCPQAVPKAALGQLREYFHSLALRNVFLTKELLKLLNLFKAHGIPAIPFKGPVLAASAYGNLSLRQFCDLDILVSEGEFLRTKDLLLSQGYKLQLQLSWESSFVHEDSKVNVDLHQGITPMHFALPLDFASLWSRLEPVSLAGKTVLNLPPEDLLLILCINGARDFWERRERLAQICDIAEVIRVHQDMDWNRVIEQASTLGSERILLLGLFLARDLLGCALPEKVLQRIHADPVVKSLAAQVCERLLGEATGPPKLFEGSLFYLKARERVQDKILYFVTPNQNDRNILSLPKFLSFLYYPLRPIRLAEKYGLSRLKRRLKL